MNRVNKIILTVFSVHAIIACSQAGSRTGFEATQKGIKDPSARNSGSPIIKTPDGRAVIKEPNDEYDRSANSSVEVPGFSPHSPVPRANQNTGAVSSGMGASGAPGF